jgi:hypothetical protein
MSGLIYHSKLIFSLFCNTYITILPKKYLNKIKTVRLRLYLRLKYPSKLANLNKVRKKNKVYYPVGNALLLWIIRKNEV